MTARPDSDAETPAFDGAGDAMEDGFDLSSLPMKKKKRKKVVVIEPGEEEDETGEWTGVG